MSKSEMAFALFCVLGLVVTANLAEAKDAHTKPAGGSKYAKTCSQLWPRYLAGITQEDMDDFGETPSAAEIALFHQQYNALCLSQGPSASDIQFGLHYGE